MAREFNKPRVIRGKLSKEEKAELAELDLHPPKHSRPKTRGECWGHPCPFVSCKYHMYLDVTPTGNIKLNFSGLEVWELKATCCLDVADRGGITLEECGEIINLTRERIRQVEQMAISKLRDALRENGICPEMLNGEE